MAKCATESYSVSAAPFGALFFLPVALASEAPENAARASCCWASAIFKTVFSVCSAPICWLNASMTAWGSMSIRGNTNIYNGGMAEEEEDDGATGGQRAKKGVIREYDNFTSKLAKAADIVLSKGRACCGGRRGG